MKLLIKAYRLLTRVERRQAWLVLGMSVIVALFEMAGTVSVMPFLAVLADPDLVQDNARLAAVYDWLGFQDRTQFLIFLGVGSFCLLLLSAAVRALGQFVVLRFSQLRGYSIARRLLEVYLRQPYSYFLMRNTGELSQKLLGEIPVLTAQVYQPLTQMAAQIVVVVALAGLLVVVNPAVAVSAILVLGSCYALIYIVARRFLTRIGRQRMAANKARFRIAGETFGGVKTVKLMGLEQSNLDRFGEAALRMARMQARSLTLGEVPRYGVEAVALGGTILLALVLLLQAGADEGEALAQVLPLLGLYAFVGYRMMPALQKVYLAMTRLRTGAPILDVIARDLAELEALPALPAPDAAPLPVAHEIALRGIGYIHEGADRPALSEIDLTLPKGTSLGIVGTTGAGKTTLMDVFLGLLAPATGQILVDGAPVTAEHLRAWQAGIGYVPQDIFLVDGSVAENIAFGQRPEAIDRARIRTCAQMAQLAEFVEEQLPQGYDTMVGERGVRLSGGQRQRIGIARALYHNPEILVFDEATSALDTVTEKAVVETIAALAGTKTMLIVAHRISTVRQCDRILVLDRGRILGLGSYDALYEANATFRALADARAEA